MTLDPKFRAFLDTPAAVLAPPPPGVTPAMMRAAMKDNPLPLQPPPIHATRDIAAPGPAGDLRVRVYRPSDAPDLPLIVYFHGGGFVLCDIDTHDPLCRELANASGCAVASVEYRLAPETKFPGPLEDCHAALSHLARAGRDLGLDATRLAVAGDSAGANLATATAMLARDRGGPGLRYQALINPVLDAACDCASMHEFSQGYFLTREVMQWFWGCYLPSAADGANPLASPLRSSNLAGLPAASITTAEFDPPRDEGEAYADSLRAAGVPVIARRYPGMIHGFASMPYLTEAANAAVADIANDLRRALRA
ncbi:MAG TPA: alpha/beta hydrolase [Steroidobacteraceae bacterium]